MAWGKNSLGFPLLGSQGGIAAAYKRGILGITYQPRVSLRDFEGDGRRNFKSSNTALWQGPNGAPPLNLYVAGALGSVGPGFKC